MSHKHDEAHRAEEASGAGDANRGRPTFSMRWFGPDDPVRLSDLQQVPGLTGIVAALHDAPADRPWPVEAIVARKKLLEDHGFAWTVAESVPVSDDIKLGTPDRDEAVSSFADSVTALGRAGVKVVCYNFMPVFDWYRTEFAAPLPDGSNAMRFRQEDFDRVDFSDGAPALAAWARGYDGHEFRGMLRRYVELGEVGLRERLVEFLADVTPVAARAGVRLAIHPDDPPWPILGLPRIVNRRDDLRLILDAVDDDANGLTFCTGALGARPDNDLPAMASEFADRIHFLHARNVRSLGEHDFVETAHLRGQGDVDLPAVIEALLASGFDGPIRPDHGRAIWGEQAIPGYGLFDRALGLAYLQGLVHGRETALATS